MLEIPEKIEKYIKNAKAEVVIKMKNGDTYTNSNLVSETMRYTESICSGEFRFGICEASVFEVDTVGIPNIKGQEIEVELVYDTSALVKDVVYVSASNAGSVWKNYNGDFLIEKNKTIEIKIRGEKFEATIGSVFYDVIQRPDRTGYDGASYQQVLPAIFPASRQITSIWDGVQNGCARYSVRLLAGGWIELYSVDSEDCGTYNADAERWEYRIPLGSFIVDTSQKTSDNMNRRHIVAYSPIAIANDSMSNPMNAQKINSVCFDKNNLVQNLDCVLYSEMPTYAMQQLSKGGTLPLAPNGANNRIGYFGADVALLLEVRYDKCVIHNNEISATSLFGYSYNISKELESKVQSAINYLISKGYDYSEYKSEIVASLKKINFSAFTEITNFYSEATKGTKFWTRKFNLLNDMAVLYPYDGSKQDISVYIPSSIRFEVEEIDESGVPITYTESILAEPTEVFELDSASVNPATISAPRIKGGTYTISGTKRTFYKFKKYPIDTTRQIAEAYCEILGGFGHYDRSGNFTIVRLTQGFNNLYPSNDIYPAEHLWLGGIRGYEIHQNEYRRLWFDDEYTKPYKGIKAIYIGTDGEESEAYFSLVDEEEIDESDAYQVYEIDNLYLKGTQHTEEEIATLLEYVAESVRNVQYMPMEVDSVGMPYLEAGDAISVHSNDGIIESYMFRRDMNGILSLVDLIK